MHPYGLATRRPRPSDRTRTCRSRPLPAAVCRRRREADEPAVADGGPGAAAADLALDVAAELRVGDLALDVSEDSVSYALRLLRPAGLLVARKQGRVVFNRLADDFPAPLRDHGLRQLIALTHTTDD